ncbi:hypothetical protein H5J25_04005 [Sphingomonas aliaeris]|uniref:Uncharacterized protein n=1 Tax=Sphingomonas aliaeris TaxID=2759526 RepID=A0A974S4T3_9SPHN|nr:hypothetical protein [Sphingomonas aliaeris]QQV77922.1 hypothetical protein H5J25_04005 [Sphingomonas aliaeris]
MIGNDIETAIELACDARALLVGTGAMHATIYVDAAIRSLRHARASLLRQARRGAPVSTRSDGWRRIVFADGMTTAVMLAPVGDGLWERGVSGSGGVEQAPGSDVEWRGPVAVDLGASLIADPRTRALAAGPVGASLLMDALAHTSWYNPETTVRWTAGVAGARSIVCAMHGNSHVAALSPALAGLAIDADVLAAIEAIGWRRDPAARWRVRDDAR